MSRSQMYVEQAPWPTLASRVRTVWSQSTASDSYVQRNLPTGGVELQCRLGGAPQLVGPLTQAAVEVLPADTTVVGARFWPGAATSLLGVPADELVDRTVPLLDLWGAEASRLGDELADVTPAVALQRLQAHLATMLAGEQQPDPLVTAAVRCLMPWRPLRVSAVPAEFSISSSQLRRRFLQSVGLAPKPLQRTLRFQGYLALAQAAGAPGGSIRPPTVADIAAEAGYADHPHLARECHRLTGLTPTQLLRGRVDRCGCDHDHAASYGPFLAGRGAARRR